MYTFRKARFIVLAGLAVTACGQRVGQPAPPLTLDRLWQAPTGTGASWEALRGRPVVLEFWATWCAPCVAEIPHLNDLATKVPAVQFLSITDESPVAVEKFLAKRPIAGWIGFDSGRSTFKAYGVEGIPHTVLVDVTGTVRGVTHAAGLTEAALTALVEGRPISLPERPKSAAGLSKQALADGPPPLVFVLIRPAADPTAGSFSSSDGSLEAKAWPLRHAVAYLNETQAARVVGSEALDTRYDMAVRLPQGSTDVRAVLRDTLTQTFKLKMRRETRTTDALALRLTADRLVESATGGSSMNSGRGRGKWTGASLSGLARTLESMLKKPVVDESGKTGRYDFELEWNPANPESIRDSVRHRLGLDLVPVTRNVQYVVVDSLETPKTR